MFRQHQLENILFLDIETVSGSPTFHELDPRMQELWAHKSLKFRKGEEDTPEKLYTEKAAIQAEFGQIVCISCGYLKFDEKGQVQIVLKSFFGPEERTLLHEFGMMLDKYTTAKEGRLLCAHNGKEFDFPYMGRRYLIHGLPLPQALRVQGKKPWEVPFLDTMELWSFGDYKAYTSLDLLSAIFGIPSPKDDMDGSQVGKVFWQEKDYERIKFYCEKDVRTTAHLLMKMSGNQGELVM